MFVCCLEFLLRRGPYICLLTTFMLSINRKLNGDHFDTKHFKNLIKKNVAARMSRSQKGYFPCGTGWNCLHIWTY